MAPSTGSSPPSELASAASARTRASSNPPIGRTVVTVSAFCVSMPVLSVRSARQSIRYETTHVLRVVFGILEPETVKQTSQPPTLASITPRLSSRPYSRWYRLHVGLGADHGRRRERAPDITSIGVTNIIYSIRGVRPVQSMVPTQECPRSNFSCPRWAWRRPHESPHFQMTP
jgi:hypothetical protein